MTCNVRAINLASMSRNSTTVPGGDRTGLAWMVPRSFIAGITPPPKSA